MNENATISFKPDLKNSFGNIFYKSYATEYVEDPAIDAGHRHDYYSVELITGGHATQYINEEKYICGPGSIVLMSPFDIHRYKFSGVLKMECLCFNEEILFADIWKNFDINSFPYAVTLDADAFQSALLEFGVLRSELERRDSMSECILKSAINKLVAQILRSAPQKTERRNRKYIGQALSYIRYHFREPITLEETADFLHITPSYFCRCFKAYTKKTFKEYLMALRLDYAMRLIKTTDKSITEICFESGFTTSAYFSKVFAKAFGINPSQVRDSHI